MQEELDVQEVLKEECRRKTFIKEDIEEENDWADQFRKSNTQSLHSREKSLTQGDTLTHLTQSVSKS